MRYLVYLLFVADQRTVLELRHRLIEVATAEDSNCLLRLEFRKYRSTGKEDDVKCFGLGLARAAAVSRTSPTDDLVERVKSRRGPVIDFRKYSL